MQSYNIVFGLMEALGKKWTVPVLVFLLIYGGTHFTKIKRHLKVTPRALSNKLKLLNALGLVEKNVMENPKKVIYTLSEKGKEIAQMLVGFVNFSK